MEYNYVICPHKEIIGFIKYILNTKGDVSQG